MKPKILFLDIETFPNVAYVWGKYDQNVIAFKQESCIATYAAKWNDGKVFAKALPDYPGYKGGSYNDKGLTVDLWNLLNEADIVVAHNGDDFDLRVIRARFLAYKLPPPAPFKSVDTKKVAKKVARFNSNSLADLGEYLQEGKKIKTDFDLWKGCIEGDPESWSKMIRYNKQDVNLLAKVYNRFLPYVDNHPNMALYGQGVCPKCGSENVQYRGYAVCSTRKYRRFQCKECGGWGRATKSEPSTSEQTNCV